MKNKHQLIQKIAVGAGINYAAAQRALESFEQCVNPPITSTEIQEAVIPPIWAQTKKGEGQPKSPGMSKHCRYG